MNKQGSLEEEGRKKLSLKLRNCLELLTGQESDVDFFNIRHLNQDDLKQVSSDPTPSGGSLPPLFFSIPGQFGQSRRIGGELTDPLLSADLSYQTFPKATISFLFTGNSTFQYRSPSYVKAATASMSIIQNLTHGLFRRLP